MEDVSMRAGWDREVTEVLLLFQNIIFLSKLLQFLLYIISDDSALLFCVIFVCPRLDHRDGQGRRRGQERRSRCHGGDREDGQRLLQVESELEGYMEISHKCPQTSPYFRQPSTMLEGRHEPCLRQGKEQMRLSPQN